MKANNTPKKFLKYKPRLARKVLKDQLLKLKIIRERLEIQRLEKQLEET